MKINTEQVREEPLEQIAAYVGYRSWREFNEMKDELASLRAKLAEAERDLAAAMAVVEDCREIINDHLPGYTVIIEQIDALAQREAKP